MLSRKEIEAVYEVREDGTVESPGKFESEPWWVVSLWDGVLQGFSDEDNGQVAFYDVDDDLREMIGLEAESGEVIALEENEMGFVYSAFITLADKETFYN